jgi:hypothetical protein
MKDMWKEDGSPVLDKKHKAAALKLLEKVNMIPIPDNEVDALHRLKLNWVQAECEPLIYPHSIELNTKPLLVLVYIYDMTAQEEPYNGWGGCQHCEYHRNKYYITTIGLSTQVLNCKYEEIISTFLHELSHARTPVNEKPHGTAFYKNLSYLIHRYNKLTGKKLPDITKDPSYRAMQHDNGFRADGIYVVS